MKVPQTVVFHFDCHRVIFQGSQVWVLELSDDDGHWGEIAEFYNRWESGSKKDDGGVMGRHHKPNVSDARRILREALATRGQSL